MKVLKIFKDLRFILIVILLLSWGISGFLYYTEKTTNEDLLLGKDSEIAALNSSIEAIGELVPAYVVTSDVPSGKMIEDSDLQLVEVPLSMANNLVQDSSELVGKHFKIGLTAGTVITVDTVYEEVITANMRYYEVLLDILPTGIQEGAFIDVRMKLGTGADYIALSHVQILEINGNVLKLMLSEGDIHTYSSLLVERIFYNDVVSLGAYLYAVEYVDGGVQEPATVNYIPSPVVLAVMNSDSNLVDLMAEDILIQRALMATVLNTFITEEMDEEEIAELQSYYDLDTDMLGYASNVLDFVDDFMKDALKDYDKKIEAEREAAEEAAKLAAEG